MYHMQYVNYMSNVTSVPFVLFVFYQQFISLWQTFRNRCESRSFFVTAPYFLAQMNLLSHTIPYGQELELFLICLELKLWFRMSRHSCVFTSDYYLILYPISYFIYFCLQTQGFSSHLLNAENESWLQNK